MIVVVVSCVLLLHVAGFVAGVVAVADVAACAGVAVCVAVGLGVLGV